MAQATAQQSHRWLPLMRTLFATLIEPAPPPPERPAERAPAHRLSRWGQIALGLTITLLAVLLDVQTLGANQRLSQRNAIPEGAADAAGQCAGRGKRAALRAGRPESRAGGGADDSGNDGVVPAESVGGAGGAAGVPPTRGAGAERHLLFEALSRAPQFASAIAECPGQSRLACLEPQSRSCQPAAHAPGAFPWKLGQGGAALIRALDLQVQALPPVPLKMNDSGVVDVFQLLMKGWKNEVAN